MKILILLLLSAVSLAAQTLQVAASTELLKADYGYVDGVLYQKGERGYVAQEFTNSNEIAKAEEALAKWDGEGEAPVVPEPKLNFEAPIITREFGGVAYPIPVLFLDWQKRGIMGAIRVYKDGEFKVLPMHAPETWGVEVAE